MKFAYTAIKEGKTVKGTIEAASRPQVIDSLTHQGIHPLVIKQVGNGAGGFLKKLSGGNKKVKLHDLVLFTRELSVMVSAGVPLPRSLVTLEAQTNNKYFKVVLASVTKDVEGGLSLADALGKFPRVFSEVYINMVRAGEAGGILDTILKRLAQQVEQDESIRKKVKSAMAYPMVILGITVIAFFGITIFVIPKIGKILNDLGGPKAKLPIYTQALLATSKFMQHYFLIIFAIMAIAIYMLRRYLKTETGKYQLHALLLRIPVIKTVLTKVAVARFSRTFASLMSSGVSVLDALAVTGGALGNKVLENELKEAAKQVKNGKQLSEPLSQSKHFPPIVAQMLAVGEETGQIDNILVKVADFYEEEVEVLIDGLSSVIEPVMIVVLGSMVGLIAASVMGPIASLSKNIGNN